MMKFPPQQSSCFVSTRQSRHYQDCRTVTVLSLLLCFVMCNSRCVAFSFLPTSITTSRATTGTTTQQYPSISTTTTTRTITTRKRHSSSTNKKWQRFAQDSPTTTTSSANTMKELPSTSASQLLLLSSHENKTTRKRNNYLGVDPSDFNTWESMANAFINVEQDPTRLRDFVQLVTILRVGIPSLSLATLSNLVYPSLALWVASVINDSGAFAVISQDSSQFIQNVLTTSGLVFSLLVGQTYYFMYQQQEAIYLALYQEVTAAKSLLEQIGLVSQGRSTLYNRILQCMNRYVQDDLQRFNDVEPAVLLSARPVDDPLEDILFLTSVGEPSIVYQTVRSLRQARAYRLGALQRKLPSIHMTLLWSLAAIVLCSFPLLGAGAQTIGGLGILKVQAWYLSFIVFGICLILGVVYELQKPGESGAYNARTVLQVMVAGLEEELQLRLSGDFIANTAGPTLDINRTVPSSAAAAAATTTTTSDSNHAAAVLSLETADDVLHKRNKQSNLASSPQPPSQQSATVVQVEESPSISNDDNMNGNKEGGSSKKKTKLGLRNKVRTWAFDLVQNSITKYK